MDPVWSLPAAFDGTHELDELGAFVVLSFHEHEPVQVYGTFPTSEAAYEWAGRQARHTTYSVHQILNIEED